jgi:hypothetical protein
MALRLIADVMLGYRSHGRSRAQPGCGKLNGRHVHTAHWLTDV